MTEPLQLPAPSASWLERCLTCGGAGMVQLQATIFPRECPTCRGRGCVTMTPDLLGKTGAKPLYRVGSMPKTGNSGTNQSILGDK